MSFINISKLHPANIGAKKLSETEQQLVVRMIKGDFEELIGISFDRFCEIYKQTLKDEPEKLI